MNDNSELIIKNDCLGEIIGRALKNNQGAEIDFTSMSLQQQGEHLICTYALDMIMNGYKADVALDFTYTSLHLLPIAVRRCLEGYLELGLSFRASVEGLAKSFAGYIFCLAMNEQNCIWNVSQLRTKLTAPDVDFGPLWGELLRITTGERRQVDFLIPAMEGGMGALKNGKGLMLFDAGPTVKAYKAAFGIDLNEYGIKPMGTIVEADR